MGLTMGNSVVEGVADGVGVKDGNSTIARTIKVP